MTAPARFLFETDFSKSDEPEAAFEETARASIPSYLATLAAAEARGYARGLADGRTEVEAQAACRLANESGRLASAAQGILAALDADRARIEKEAAELAFLTAKKISSRLISQQPAGEITALIDACLGPMRNAPHIVVRVDERDADNVKTEADRIAHERGFMGRLVVLGEPDMASGDCRIEWADGGIVRDRATIEVEIEHLIEQHFAARDAAPDQPDAPNAAETPPANTPAMENGR